MTMRLLMPACLLLALSPVLSAAAPPQKDEVLEAARVASDVYNRHIALLVTDLAGKDIDKRVKALNWLGRSRDSKVVPFITPYLDADVYELRTVKAACLAVTALGAYDATSTLKRLAAKEDLNDDEKQAVRLAALNALAQLDALDSNDYKRESSVKGQPPRGSGVTNLGTLKVDDAGKILAGALKDRSIHVRRMAAIGLGRLGQSDYGPDLAEALTDGDAFVRRYAAESLVLLNYRKAIPNLLMAMDANIAGAHMVWAMKKLSGEDFGFNPRANQIDRQNAVHEGFKWWTANKKDIE